MICFVFYRVFFFSSKIILSYSSPYANPICCFQLWQNFFCWWTMDLFSRQSALNVWNVNPKSVTYLTSTCQAESVRMQMQLQSASLKHKASKLLCKSHFWVHHSGGWQASASLIKQSIVLEAPFFQRLFRWIGSPFLSHRL